MNTLIRMTYRDADNYKTYKEVVLKGAITDEQVGLVWDHCEDEGRVIASQVGITGPLDEKVEECGIDYESDHVWTELDDFMNESVPLASDLLVNTPTVDLTVDQFVENMMAVTWDVIAEMQRIGL